MNFFSINHLFLERPLIRRLISIGIDHAFGTLTIIGCIYLISIDVDIEEYLDELTVECRVIYMSFFVVFYMSKDFNNGQSLGKILTKSKLIDIGTGEAPSFFKCFIRNITVFIWPIELLVVILNQERRIGDFIANTKVINL